ncbi:calcium/sodium antiporter [Saccharicrinis aurantiacus]|uniref:calcium/sodium antiporter n=1 Tax=Saccharicrinis aurantiacus TaxID=1849719 RepID=UPI0024926774|nr:calcium/sodium antiporter [Saccharicrinis aurantiacus]
MSVLMLVAGLTLLFFSGDWLVKASVEIARYLKVSTLVIGVTVVAFGTSAPELLVSLKAVFSGSPDISIGNVVGSNIANIALVLGAVSIILPIKVKNKALWIDWSVMMFASLLFYIFAYDRTVGLIEGICFIVLLIIYLLWSVFKSRLDSKKQGEQIKEPTLALWKAILLLLLASVGLYLGSEWLVSGAKSIAAALNVSDRVIGISVVAFGTSVPELATSLIAAFRKETDISIGNIIGSNIFNLLGVIGVTSILKPLNVSLQIIQFDVLVMVFVAFLLLVMIIPLKRGVLTRWKGAILVALYAAYMFILFAN